MERDDLLKHVGAWACAWLQITGVFIAILAVIAAAVGLLVKLGLVYGMGALVVALFLLLTAGLAVLQVMHDV